MRLSTTLSLFLCASGAVAQVAVIEPATRALLVDGRTVVSLAVNNGGPRPVDVRITLQWLSPDGEGEAQIQRDATLPAGESSIHIPLGLCEDCDPLLLRLAYLVQAGSRNFNASRPVPGVLSLPHIAGHAFSLRILTAGSPVPNEPFEVRVLASHPMTGAPVAGVKVSAGPSTGMTDAEGLALLQITRGPEDETAIKVDGQLGDFRGQAALPYLLNRRESLMVSTDKPIYQPGQTMHVRLLALAQNGRPREGGEFEAGVMTEAGELQFRTTLRTSRYGIASADWEIPASAESGRYTIRVSTKDGQSLSREVQIRRYELPSFRVTVQPDRPFLLIGDPARVTIQGEYLFGKPVSAGKVRVAAAENVDKVIAEGEVSREGRFQAVLPATLDVGRYAKFRDRQYIAFLTDGSTNRTEQRRFAIRISRDPVHVYVARQEDVAEGRRVYVTAYSPGGLPLDGAVVEVAVGGRTLGRGRTNRFGLARIELPGLGGTANAPEMQVTATTADRKSARMQVPPHYGEPATLWLETDRTLYRAGQPVKCILQSTSAPRTVLLLAVNEQDRVVFSKSVRVDKGRMVVEIPYERRFGRALSVGVIASGGPERPPVGRVYFPGPSELVIKAKPVQRSYRPGETAVLEFETSPRAALGIAIVDQSVMERAATDSAFGGRSWFEHAEPESVSLGGITEASLLNLDPAKVDDAELQLAAELLAGGAGKLLHSARNVAEELRNGFQTVAAHSLEPVKRALDSHYLDTLEHPGEDGALQRIAGYALGRARDPWLQPYRPKFAIRRGSAQVTFVSAGADKLMGTADDFPALEVGRQWFAPQEALLRRALPPERDAPATPEGVLAVLDNAGLRFDRLRDPWGSGLRLEMEHRRQLRMIRVISAGPDRMFGTADDVPVTELQVTYFSEMESTMERLLRSVPELPGSEGALRSVLSRGGIAFDTLRDPWGRPYYSAFRDEPAFTDRIRTITYAEYNRGPEERKQITPVKVTTRVVEIRSVGEDSKRDTYDDFAVAVFRRVMEEPAAGQPAPVSVQPGAPASGKGTLAGVVIDQAGGVVPFVEVKLNERYEARTDAEGRFVFGALPPGRYRISCQAAGFQLSVVGGVPVEDGKVTEAQITLRVGSVTEMLQIAAAPSMLSTSSASVASRAAAFAPQPLSTPRVREYFPETLYWQPELITDEAGRATVRVKLADSVTSWHVAVMGSTLDGRITEASTEVRAFQPFLVDLDVPAQLTVGDEIALPVPVRNYLERPQKVVVTAKVSSELGLLGAIRQPETVGASAAGNAVVSLRAGGAGKRALVRVTARGASAADAMEKPVVIQPDGERRTAAAASLVNVGESLALWVPSNAMDGSIEGQVKVYPSLLARIMEAIEVMLEAPNGCGEQTISSTYPNLLLLQALRQAGVEEERLAAKARRNLLAGCQRLLRYQSRQGGFTYWARGDNDVALTSYALTFLRDAAAFVEVDAEVVERARSWLARQPSPDAATNALRLRALGGGDGERELGEMARRAAEYSDPYAWAAYALAAMHANRQELAAPVIEQLRRAAQEERGAAWWALRANTPFHGWGQWGRVETTALAVSALAEWRKLGHADDSLNRLIARGSLFLLRNTGARGAWATSQSTVRALLALLAVEGATGFGKPTQFAVMVNGASAGKVMVDGGRGVQGPVLVDVSRFLRAGDNQVALAGVEAGMQQVQVSAAWYEPWAGDRASRDFTMEIAYDRLEAAVNDRIACDVVISRPAFRGYGMLIGKVGLPPGAEVDRGMLEEVVGGDNGVDHYEVAPGEVTFYVWPRAADTKFRFYFRPRYAMRARGMQSVLYDYYNPDAQVVLAPPVFVVRP